MAHGSAADVARAKAILNTMKPERLDTHAIKTSAAAGVIALGAA
jgi:hypothetical protein